MGRSREELDVPENRRLVGRQEGGGPVRPVVDLGRDAGLMDFIAAIGLDSIVGDLSPRPVDLVDEVVALIVSIEAKEGYVAVGRAQDRIFGLDGGKGKLRFVGVLGAVQVDQSPFDQRGHLVEPDLDGGRIGSSRAHLAERVHKASLGADQHVGKLDVDLASGRDRDPLAAGAQERVADPDDRAGTGRSVGRWRVSRGDRVVEPRTSAAPGRLAARVSVQSVIVSSVPGKSPAIASRSARGISWSGTTRSMP